MTYLEIKPTLVGFTFHSLYLRWVLCPLSHLTTVNISHTLCSLGDPLARSLGMGKWHWLYADIYLSILPVLGCIVFYSFFWLIFKLTEPKQQLEDKKKKKN